MAERKLDIFAALTAMDTRDGGWLERQPDDARKEFAPPVFLRWASAVSDGLEETAYMLSEVNTRVNIGAEAMMTQYPDLMFRLAASCGYGQRLRHQWIAGTSRRSKADPLLERIAAFFPLASRDELDRVLRLHTKETLKSLLEDHGTPPDEIKEALKHYGKRRSNDEPDSSPKPPRQTKRRKSS